MTCKQTEIMYDTKTNTKTVYEMKRKTKIT